MLRRSWLRLIFGIGGFVFITQDWLVRLVQAQGTPTRLPPPLGSVSAAIGSGNPAAMASFILAHPGAASAASIQDRATMIRAMGGVMDFGACCDGIWRQANLSSLRGEYERAALLILSDLDRKPGERADLIKAVGGRATIELRLAQIGNLKLKALATAALQP